ncbi:hypothetical protein DIPPA_27610 [Diplonema papillatum]|nr:hypothetical protein DIPPA_27610 [Diplonema papillatum]
MSHSRQLAAVMAFVVTLSLTLSGKQLSPNAMAEMRPASIVSRGDLLTILHDMQDSAGGYAERLPPPAEPANLAAPAGRAAATRGIAGAPDGRDAGVCRTWDDIREGELVLDNATHGHPAVWIPKSGCALRGKQDIPFWRRCLLNKNIVFIGDSLMHVLTTRVAAETGLKSRKKMFPHPFKKGLLCPVSMCGFHDQMARFGAADNGHKFSFYHCPSARNNATLKRPWVIDEVRKANYVIYGGGMWDMGVHFNKGPETFFKETYSRLGKLKAMLKPGAELIVYRLYHIHPEIKCPSAGLCKTCNNQKKAAAYRDALDVAAACLGLRVLDTVPMTRPVLVASLSRDGIHYLSRFNVASDILANAICGDAPDMLTHQTECDIEGSHRRWATIPEAHVGCKKK